MTILFRVGRRCNLEVIGTYCPDTPHRNAQCTQQEREWISWQRRKGQEHRNICVIAGDFNAYTDDRLDRQGINERDRWTQRASVAFCDWTEEQEVISTFNLRHPTTQRFTYQNGAIKTALDDVYISAQHAHQVKRSGIWLYSLNRGDHVGTPFVSLALDRVQRTNHMLQGQNPIKVLAVRRPTPAELLLFSSSIEDELQIRPLRLPPPLPDESDGIISSWLHTAITHLYDCMYQAAKSVWGETSQSRRAICRAVSIKRTARCHGQYKGIRRLQQPPTSTVEMLRKAYRQLQWPKWVVFPERIPSISPHAEGAKRINLWRCSEQPRTLPELNDWLNRGWKLWKTVIRSRRSWRQRRRLEGQRVQRGVWMVAGEVGKLLRATVGRTMPPVNIRGAFVGDRPQYDYVETREAVTAAMTDLLSMWVPRDQKTTEPQHLVTGSEEDEENLPRFVRDWMLNDIKAGGTHKQTFMQDGQQWSDFRYNDEMQSWVDKQVNTNVSPGYGGIPQELWIAAPRVVREYEQLIMNTILRTGCVPEILNHRQMVFLPKSPQATGVWDRQGLPLWRPITIQSSFMTRLFTATSGYIECKVPNHRLQHGFQRNRSVQDAALATTLLLDRAKQRKEELYILSKDCEKCYDRIPHWVMAYIYRRIGTPPLLYNILMGFLGAGEIDVRTAFGWVKTGKREFGLGQGSVLSIRHIGVYMDLLMERQDQGIGAVVTCHGQRPGNETIAATVLVDDIVDVATTREGIESRVKISNLFTGIHATGGIFGAKKSFFLHYHPGRQPYEDTVYLNDGYGVPQPVAVVSPAGGFKHLGVYQSSNDIWSKTMRPVWNQLKADAKVIMKCRLTSDQLRYIVNSVWIPRIQYRTQLGSTIKLAHHVDKLARRVARTVLKLPFGTPLEIFHDRTQGIGLTSLVDACHTSRVQLALRVHNSPHVPAYHLLVECFELYQIQAGLTCHPLELALEPPPHLHDWVHQTVRAAARLRVSISVDWKNPAECTSSRPNDRPIWFDVTRELQQRILLYNVKSKSKSRFVGDITDAGGTKLARKEHLAHKGRWSLRQQREYESLEGDLKAQCCRDGTQTLLEPVGRTVHNVAHLDMAVVEIPSQGFFIVSQYIVQNGMLALRGYELGQRIGDSTTDNELGFGLEIDVQWWHKRHPGTDVWSIRPDGQDTEYAELCVPVEVTQIRSGQRW